MLKGSTARMSRHTLYIRRCALPANAAGNSRNEFCRFTNTGRIGAAGRGNRIEGACPLGSRSGQGTEGKLLRLAVTTYSTCRQIRDTSLAKNCVDEGGRDGDCGKFDCQQHDDWSGLAFDVGKIMVSSQNFSIGEVSSARNEEHSHTYI